MDAVHCLDVKKCIRVRIEMSPIAAVWFQLVYKVGFFLARKRTQYRIVIILSEDKKKLNASQSKRNS